MSAAPASTPGHWAQGENEIEGFLNTRELERVEPSEQHANLLIEQAEAHLAVARAVIEEHPPSAITLIYDAARKAMTAVLAKQGLRPTTTGGHRVVQDAIEAQLGPNNRAIVRAFRTMRTRRHESEYPEIGTPSITTDEARQAFADATEIVARMKQLLPVVGPF